MGSTKWLSAISFKKGDDEVVLSAKINDENHFKIDLINLNCIKKNFLNWITYASGKHTMDNLYVSSTIGEVFGGNETELKDCLEHIRKYVSTLQIPTEAKLGYKSLIDMGCTIDNYNPNKVWEYLEYSLESNTILYLPLVAKLSSMSKCESIQYITDLKNRPNTSVKIRRFADNIIADFSESAYDKFADYYLAKEETEGLLFDKDRLDTALFTKKINGVFQLIKSGTNIESSGLCFCASEVGPSFTFENDAEMDNNGAKECVVIGNVVNKFTFSDFYGTMVKLSLIDDIDSLNGLINSYSPIPEVTKDVIINNDSHKLMSLFGEYLQAIILDAMSPNQLMDNKYVGSNRINVQRLYTFDDKNSDFSQLLFRYFNAKRNYRGKYTPDSFINSWLRKFDIGESIEIKLTEEGFGATIYMTKQSGERVLLADEGYGISQLVSVILEIETAILEAKTYECRIENSSKPFALLLEDEREVCYNPSTIAIEEPEVHLHPRYQSMLAEMFLEAYKSYNIYFIVETHSEYLIRKLQTLVAKQYITSFDIALHYIDRVKGTQSPNVRHIAIENDGRLSSPLGSGFFDEADNLAMNLLEIKAGL